MVTTRKNALELLERELSGNLALPRDDTLSFLKHALQRLHDVNLKVTFRAVSHVCFPLRSSSITTAMAFLQWSPLRGQFSTRKSCVISGC